MLIQMVTIMVKPGHADDFIEAFRINYEGTRQEPGNLRFDVLRDPDDGNKFLIYEVFQSEAALEEHRRTPHYQKCVSLLEPIQIGPRSKVFYNAEMADFLGEEFAAD